MGLNLGAANMDKYMYSSLTARFVAHSHTHKHTVSQSHTHNRSGADSQHKINWPDNMNPLISYLNRNRHSSSFAGGDKHTGNLKANRSLLVDGPTGCECFAVKVGSISIQTD